MLLLFCLYFETDVHLYYFSSSAVLQYNSHVEYLVATDPFNIRVGLHTVGLAGNTGSYAVGANNNNKADSLSSPIILVKLW